MASQKISRPKKTKQKKRTNKQGSHPVKYQVDRQRATQCCCHKTRPKQVCRSVLMSFFMLSVVIPEHLQEISTLFFGAMTGS